MFKKISRWLSALLGLLPMAAFADTSGPFVVKSTDISVKILSQIFGGLMPDGGTDAFHGAIATFNGAVLIVGGILATYTLLAGTLGTAHDGEMLGKKFSSVWIPIRYALGTALVLPVLSGGYCMMQQLVMWCILQGVGLANSVWISYLTSSDLTIPVAMTPAHKKEILNFANNIALAQICVQANAAIFNAGGSGGGTIDKIVKAVNKPYNYSVGYTTIGNRTLANFGDLLSGNILGQTLCGGAVLTTIPAAQNIVPTSVSSGGKLGDISKAFQLGDVKPVYLAHLQQSKLLIASMGVSAAKAVGADAPFPESDVSTAVDTYVSAVEIAANGYANGDHSPFAGIVAASQDQGWILAGAWFTKLAMMNQSLNDAVNATPSAVAVWQLGENFKYFSTIQAKIGTVRPEIIAALNISVPDNSSDSKDDSKGKATQSSENGSKIVQWVVQVFTGLDLETLQNSTKHPMLVLQDAGNRMITAWSVATTGLMAILTVTGISVLGNHWDGGPVVFTLIGFAFLPIAGLVTLGFTLAYLLPNLPFLMWIGIILGWLIMCVEAILAAPLWAVMHLHPSGDDLTGRGGNGYMLLLGLLLRPALTIFGLIAALVLTEVMGEFVNKIFFSVFFSGSGSGLVTILSVVFSLTVYTSAMVQLFRKTFSLMHVIPDQLMRWIGGGQEQMGQYAGGMAEAGQKGVQAAGTASSFLGEKTAQNAGQAIGQIKNMQDGRANKAAKEEGVKNEMKSQEAGLSSSGVSDGGIAQMNKRTEQAQSELASSNPQSQAGLVLRESQGKMLKSRASGTSQVSEKIGKDGVQDYSEAIASGEYDGKNIAQMEGNNKFEIEANWASFVSNKIISNGPKPRAEEANMGKQNDSTITSPVVESGNSEGEKQSAENTFVNNAMATNLNGELLNPTLAQALAVSGNVSSLGKGLTPNAANVIQHGGKGNSPSSVETTSFQPIADSNSAEGHSTGFNTRQVNEDSASQSFDGSGGSQTGNNGSSDGDSQF